ncbi:MAG: M48 family metallopeptidase [Desulfobacterales bacterium]|nr:M48 family metallopeptidase [Desulfobacterales bacterium]
MISSEQEVALGEQAYNDMLLKVKLSKDKDLVEMVNRVGNRIAKVAERPDYNWEFSVIDDDNVANAFALPGGKTAVYTGILKYTADENGLAFVLAHEIAHALARHGAERMSQMMLLQLGQAGIGAALYSESEATQIAVSQAYNIASTVGITLPYSRTQEYEADHIGLILMAKAGYDPKTATAFFKRMLAGNSGGRPLEILSTHPADDKRLAELQALIPEARKYYKKRKN